MEISIKVLNVKEADAIIIHLKKSMQDLVLLIDGGKAKNASDIIYELNQVLIRTNKLAPDIIINTHYDSDHIGGLLNIVKYYGNNIKEIWMQKALKISRTEVKFQERYKNDTLFPNSESTEIIISGASQDTNYYDFLINSFKQRETLQKMISTFPKIKLKDLMVGKCIVNDWPEIKVIGPSQAFFRKLIPTKISSSFINAEITAIKNEKINFSRKILATDPCHALDKISKQISAINLASAIILITINRKKFLFTADVGIESFKAIKNYKQLLKNIFWLKLPHHGSEKNLNTELISLMKPTHVYISGSKNIDNNLVKCLFKSTKNIKTTKTGHIEYFYS